MWSVKVELVDSRDRVTLTNEYEYETANIATRCALDALQLLAESDHVSDLESAETS